MIHPRQRYFTRISHMFLAIDNIFVSPWFHRPMHSRESSRRTFKILLDNNLWLNNISELREKLYDIMFLFFVSKFSFFFII